MIRSNNELLHKEDKYEIRNGRNNRKKRKKKNRPIGIKNKIIRKKKEPPLKKHPFFNSDEWVRLRRKVLRIYGCVCMKCKVADVIMQVDHIKPRSKYPNLELELSNLQVLCMRCNKEKSNTDETDYRPNTLIPLNIK